VTSPLVPLARFEQSPYTRLLIQRLRQVPVGAVVEYAALTRELGIDVDGRARHLLRSARTRLLEEEGIVFDAVTAVGIKRLDDVGTVDVAEGRTRITGRQIRRTLKIAGTVRDPKGLPPAARARHEAVTIKNGVMAVLFQPKAQRAIKAAAENEAARPSYESIVTPILAKLKGESA
jgi:hypothetical protein